MVVSVDGYWGSEMEDGTWNGMVGMVERGEVEFGVSDFHITSDRSNVVDFTIPCLLYTSPSPRDRQKSRMPYSA